MEKNWLPNDFKELLQFLNANLVEYLLIGGWAVGYYGYVRATADIDFWYCSERANVDRLIRALHEFGAADPVLTTELLMQPGKILRMGRAPTRIEFTNRIDGVEFEPCYERRLIVKIDEISTPLISLADLLVNKRASNRPKDLADIEGLTG